MNLAAELRSDYKKTIADFMKAASLVKSAQVIEAELAECSEQVEQLSPSTYDTALKTLTSTFHHAMQQKSAFAKSQGADASAEDIARAVANDINAASPKKPDIGSGDGTPTWFAKDMHELFNWLQDPDNDSVIAMGIEAGFKEIGISAPPSVSGEESAPHLRVVA